MACETSIKEKLGLVQVYTGNGKGKTTAALGLSFRAAGRGLRVAMVQFMKPEEGYGEQVSAGSLENFEIHPMGMSPLVGREPARRTSGRRRRPFPKPGSSCTRDVTT
jgi:cob(I)alamin adenosyltransferase